MPETHFDEWIAERYEILWPELFDPAVIDPTVDFLAQLAAAGPALELGIGIGRIALPLEPARRSRARDRLVSSLVAQFRRREGAGRHRRHHRRLATARPGGTVQLVYLLLPNTITNLTTQDEHI
jgi:hypothetical protein